MVIKYIAQRSDPENVAYEDYLPADQIEKEHIWVGGNRHLIELNEDEFKKVYEALSHLGNDLDDINLDSMPINELETEFDQIFNYYFPDHAKYSRAEINELADLGLKIFDGCSVQEEIEAVARAISIREKKPYASVCLYGAVQGDWVYAIYPVGSEDLIDLISACYFGTGTEIGYCEYTPKAQSRADLDDFEYFFTSEIDDEKALANDLNVSVDEIKFFDSYDDIDEWIADHYTS